MSGLHYVLAFLVAIGVLVVVHEFGHYLAARLCGVKVLRFSLGFGPQIFCRTARNGTEWSLAAIPLGGYVRMLDEREGEVAPEERGQAFNVQPLRRRALIVAAGPAANLLFAVLVFWLVAVIGWRDLPATVGRVEPGSRAAQAGLAAGDQVLRFGESDVRSWSDLRWQLTLRAFDSGQVPVDVDRGGAQRTGLLLDMQGGLEVGEAAADPLAQVGLFAPQPKLPPVLGEPVAQSPAARAGLRSGDRVLQIDGQSVETWQAFVEMVSHAPGRALLLRVQRGGEVLTLSVTPDAVGEAPVRGRIGVPYLPDPDMPPLPTVVVRYGPFEAIGFGLRQTLTSTWFSLETMWRIVRGQVSLRNVSGPVTIADYAGQSARAGLESYLRFLAMVSISLGVLNLLPVPVLDGGHLLYYAIEAIRGRALSARAEEIGQKIGLVFLALLMSLAFFNDFHRVFFG